MATKESEAVLQLSGMLEKLQVLRETATTAMEENNKKVEQLEAENKRLREENTALQSELAELKKVQP